MNVIMNSNIFSIDDSLHSIFDSGTGFFQNILAHFHDSKIFKENKLINRVQLS